LFALDPEPEATERTEAEHRVAVARQRWEDLKKGQRPSELEALAARRKQAEVSLHLAELELKRVETLSKEKVASVDELDRVRTTRDFYLAQVAQLKAEIETANLGGREDLVQAAQAEVAAAQSAMARAEWNVQQKSQRSPVSGLVHDTLYRSGEWVAAGRPVIVLLPPTNLKVRFFVPQAVLPQMTPGLPINVHLDGVAAPVDANVNYVSTQAEFTPPVIYSRETRAKLVFMIEARFKNPDPSILRPGQPVDVTWSVVH
jgi:HlyD family secretion protein